MSISEFCCKFWCKIKSKENRSLYLIQDFAANSGAKYNKEIVQFIIHIQEQDFAAKFGAKYYFTKENI